MERAHFNKRSQKPGESVDTFIQDLYRLVDNCFYGTLKDDLIRDRIVMEIFDDSLSDRLQSKGTLTLAQAVHMSRQAESRTQNRDLVHGDSNPAQVEFVDPGKSGNKKAPNKESSKRTPSCGWCGRERHHRQVCPAKDATCNKCKKGDTFKMFVAALYRQQRKYVNWKKMKSRNRGMRFYFWRSSNHRGWLDCSTRS